MPSTGARIPADFTPVTMRISPALLLASLLLAPGLDSTARAAGADADAAMPIVLREGDELRITFPGAPNLDTVQKIRSDGRVSLSLVGEVRASGMAPMEFQTRLSDLYKSQLINNEVNVVLQSRSFFVYVNGAVAKQGRNEFERPVDLLEAIMSAGFNDDTANLKAVQVIRVENGVYRVFTENIQLILDGKQRDPFMLRQADMILVPRRWL
jgi:polysaccharide export outer membrane protein